MKTTFAGFDFTRMLIFTSDSELIPTALKVLIEPFVTDDLGHCAPPSGYAEWLDYAG
jgi:hypothetical protein